MRHSSTTPTLTRLRGWLRRHLRIALHVVVSGAILGLFLFPVFGESFIKTWGVPEVLIVSLAGVAGNLIASYLWKLLDEPNPPSPSRDAQTAARVRYLTGLRAYCQSLPLAALGGNEGIDQGPTLDDVYIALNTTTAVPVSETEPAPQREARRAVPDHGGDTRLLTALEAVQRIPRLVLLGDPGAGKSTFVRSVLASLPPKISVLGPRP